MGAAGCDFGLEVVDRAVAALDLLRGSELAHPADQDILVVRPVEHADESGRRRLPFDAPQEVVRALLGGGSQAHRTVRRTPRARMFRGMPLPARTAFQPAR